MPRARDLAGMQFGLLTAVEQTKLREKGCFVWRCVCECGDEALVNTKHLLRGTVTDCGCRPKVSARRGTIAENLTGQHFGEWKVLHRAENKNKRVMWNCQCSCGTLRIISAHDLKAGKTKCCRNPVHSHLYNRRDLTGESFGSLKVLSATAERDYKGSVMWRCKCELCGNEKKLSEDALVHGKYKSCGCGQYIYGKELQKLLHHYKGTCLESLSLERKVRSDSKTGVTGVSRRKNGTYKARIGFRGRNYCLGTYDTLREAEVAYQKAKQKLHGGFIAAYKLWMEDGRSEELIFEVKYTDGEFLIESNYLVV